MGHSCSYPRHIPETPHFCSLVHSVAGTYLDRLHQSHPHITSGLVMSSPMVDVYSKPIPKSVLKAASTLMMKVLPEKYAFGHAEATSPTLWGFDGNTGTTSRKRFNLRINKLLDNPKLVRGGASWGLAGTLTRLTNELQREKEIKKMVVPMIMFQGEFDYWVDNAAQNRFCNIAASCELVVMEDSLHEIFNERDSIRDVFMNRLLEMLNRHHGSAIQIKEDHRTERF